MIDPTIESAKNPPKITPLISVERIEISNPNNKNFEVFAPKHSNHSPLLVTTNIRLDISKSEAEEALDSMAKGNPAIKEMLKNPALRTEILQMISAQSHAPMNIPIDYLTDKKPNSTIAYLGSVDTTHPIGFNMSEKEGDAIISKALFSFQEDDASFIKKPTQKYTVTQEFCKQANNHLKKFETSSQEEEKRLGFKECMPGIKNSELADKLGITPGWTGGKPVMNMGTEKKSLSSRPR